MQQQVATLRGAGGSTDYKWLLHDSRLVGRLVALDRQWAAGTLINSSQNKKSMRKGPGQAIDHGPTDLMVAQPTSGQPSSSDD